MQERQIRREGRQWEKLWNRGASIQRGKASATLCCWWFRKKLSNKRSRRLLRLFKPFGIKRAPVFPPMSCQVKSYITIVILRKNFETKTFKKWFLVESSYCGKYTKNCKNAKKKERRKNWNLGSPLLEIWCKMVEAHFRMGRTLTMTIIISILIIALIIITIKMQLVGIGKTLVIGLVAPATSSASSTSHLSLSP